jgi:hypothetical protein
MRPIHAAHGKVLLPASGIIVNYVAAWAGKEIVMEIVEHGIVRDAILWPLGWTHRPA